MIRADESDIADFTPAFKCAAKDMEYNDGKVFQVDIPLPDDATLKMKAKVHLIWSFSDEKS